MSQVVRTTVTLDVESVNDHRNHLLEIPHVLEQLDGVERIDVKQKLESIPSVTLEVLLVGTSKAQLRSMYNRISKLASQSPLRLRSRTCTLNDIFD